MDSAAAESSYAPHNPHIKFTCDVCWHKCRDKDDLINHMGIHKGKYECDLCGRKFFKRRFLNVHRLAHSGAPTYECDICRRQFALRNELTDHQRIHAGQKPYECEICPVKFPKETWLNKHRRNKHGLKKARKFHEAASRKYAYMHDFRPTTKLKKIKEFECDVCLKRFNLENYMLKHRARKHGGE